MFFVKATCNYLSVEASKGVLWQSPVDNNTDTAHYNSGNNNGKNNNDDNNNNNNNNNDNKNNNNNKEQAVSGDPSPCASGRVSKYRLLLKVQAVAGDPSMFFCGGTPPQHNTTGPAGSTHIQKTINVFFVYIDAFGHPSTHNKHRLPRFLSGVVF